MRTSPTDGEVQGCAPTDRALLGLLVERHDLPWTVLSIEDELGDVLQGIPGLEEDGLLHHWDHHVAATHAAINFHEAWRTPDDDLSELGWTRRVLAVLLSPAATNGLLEGDIVREAGARNDDHRRAVADALRRLQRVELVDRDGDVLCASAAAVNYARLMLS